MCGTDSGQDTLPRLGRERMPEREISYGRLGKRHPQEELYAFFSDALVASSVKAASAAFSSIVFFSAAVMPYFFSI